jgi:hypothetical protein
MARVAFEPAMLVAQQLWREKRKKRWARNSEEKNESEEAEISPKVAYWTPQWAEITSVWRRGRQKGRKSRPNS